MRLDDLAGTVCHALPVAAAVAVVAVIVAGAGAGPVHYAAGGALVEPRTPLAEGPGPPHPVHHPAPWPRRRGLRPAPLGSCPRVELGRYSSPHHRSPHYSRIQGSQFNSCR